MKTRKPQTVMLILLIALLGISMSIYTLSPAFARGETMAGPGVELLYLPIVRNCPSLYYDNFSNASSGWPVADFGETLYEYRNGEYRILVRETNWLAAARPGVAFTDYLLSAQVRSMNTNAGTFGLAFGLSDDFSSTYTFEIDVNGNYEFWRFQSGWALIDSGSSSAILPGLASNKLAVERNGDQVKFFVNGTLIDSATEGSLTGSRYVGVIASNFDDGSLDIRYDNFTVEPIGCGLSEESPSASADALTDAFEAVLSGELTRPRSER